MVSPAGVNDVILMVDPDSFFCTTLGYNVNVKQVQMVYNKTSETIS